MHRKSIIAQWLRCGERACAFCAAMAKGACGRARTLKNAGSSLNFWVSSSSVFPSSSLAIAMILSTSISSSTIPSPIFFCRASLISLGSSVPLLSVSAMGGACQCLRGAVRLCVLRSRQRRRAGGGGGRAGGRAAGGAPISSKILSRCSVSFRAAE